MSVDFVSSTLSTYALSGGMDFLVTEYSLHLISGARPQAFADLPFVKRMSMVIDSIGWSPTVLSRLLIQSPHGCVTATDEEGKTALHWAAMHFGQWLRRSAGLRSGQDMAESYSKLASELVANRADVHACWTHLASYLTEHTTEARSFWNQYNIRDNQLPYISPFGSFLQGFDNLWSFLCGFQRKWDSTSLSDAIARWGSMIVKGGLDLEKYAIRETQQLRRSQYAVKGLRSGEFSPVELVALDGTKLAVRVVDISKVYVYKARPAHIPGAWPVSTKLPNTIIWSPGTSDEQDGFRWSCIGEMCMTSAAYLVQQTDSDETSGKSLWDIEMVQLGLFECAHDDHGLKSKLFAEASCAGSRKTQANVHRRAASCPPDGMRRQNHSFSRFVGTSRRYIHKCLLDARWHLSSSPTDSWRTCMLGKCRPGSASVRGFYWWENSWEYMLFRNEDHVQVAKRFAARFCPENMDIVERTQAVSAERARLGIGPVKPSGWF